MTRDERYISMALELAEKALKEGEIPVGAVVVCGDTVVGRGYNRTGESALSTAHAEIIAIEEANGIIGDRKSVV